MVAVSLLRVAWRLAEPNEGRATPSRTDEAGPDYPVLPDSGTEAAMSVRPQELPLAVPVAGRNPDHAAVRESHDPHLAVAFTSRPPGADPAMKQRLFRLEDHPRSVDVALACSDRNSGGKRTDQQANRSAHYQGPLQLQSRHRPRSINRQFDQSRSFVTLNGGKRAGYANFRLVGSTL
jgi:hypothetical protein